MWHNTCIYLCKLGSTPPRATLDVTCIFRFAPTTKSKLSTRARRSAPPQRSQPVFYFSSFFPASSKSLFLLILLLLLFIYYESSGERSIWPQAINSRKSSPFINSTGGSLGYCGMFYPARICLPLKTSQMFFVFFYLSIGETEQRTFAAEDGTSRLDELAPGAGRLSVDGQRPTESRRPARRRAQPDGLRLHGVLGLHHQVKKKGAPWFPLSIGVVVYSLA